MRRQLLGFKKECRIRCFHQTITSHNPEHMMVKVFTWTLFFFKLQLRVMDYDPLMVSGKLRIFPNMVDAHRRVALKLYPR